MMYVFVSSFIFSATGTLVGQPVDISDIREQAGAEILDTRVVWAPDNIYIGWPTITRDKEDNLYVVFSGDRDAHVCPWGKTELIRSSDGGKTWTQPEIINNTPLDDRDAGIIVTSRGTWIVSWFTSLAFRKNPEYRRHYEKLSPEIRRQWLGYWVRRSEDQGKSWGKPVRVGVSAPHGPINLDNGNLLYVGKDWGHSQGLEDTEQRLPVLLSKDDGKTWKEIGEIPIAPGDKQESFWEPHVVQCKSGKLVAQIRYTKGDDHFLRQSESEDGGHTWSVAHPTRIWGYPPHLLRLNDGRLLTTYGRRKPPFGERACISSNEGKSWDVDHEIIISSGLNSDLGYPATTQLSDGTLVSVYYQVYDSHKKAGLMITRWKLTK